MLIKNVFKYWTRQLFAPDAVLQEKYESYKSLLIHDRRAHELMAELEEIYYRQIVVDFKVIEDKYDELSTCVGAIVKDLQRICPTRYLDLNDYYKKFDAYARFILSPKSTESAAPYVILMKEISEDNEMQTGGKAMHLRRAGKRTKIPTPNGFVITSNAFNAILEINELRKSIDARLADLDVNSTTSLSDVSEELTNLVLQASIPAEIENAVTDAVKAVWPIGTKDLLFALRSSAVREDSRASFAGQYLTVLNVGYCDIFDAYKQVIASKYSPEAIYYRIQFGFSDIETPMAVLCLEMINAKVGGVMHTRDLEDPESDHAVIYAVRGTGDKLVSGRATPNMIKVSKKKLPGVNTEIKEKLYQNSPFTAHDEFEYTDLYESVSLSREAALSLTRLGIALFMNPCPFLAKRH
ncbi:MAG: PEP/pyruvate-binding domain-containing protein [Desulfobacterales bacterium]